MQWREKYSGNNCSFPSIKNLWTVHGIWPTKIGSKEGPSFCNKTLKFNKTALIPIEKKLEQYWINIESNTNLYSLWKHEWVKHGTCAAELPTMNSEVKYFQEGLNLAEQYNIEEILLKSLIISSQTPYNISDIFNAVTKSLTKRPIIKCVFDKHVKKNLLSEIWLCLDKNFTLIDCDINKNHSSDFNEILTNCDQNKLIMYYDQTPSFKLNYLEEAYSNYYMWVKVYNMLLMIIKFTL